jgi:hypothetical protein
MPNLQLSTESSQHQCVRCQPLTACRIEGSHTLHPAADHTVAIGALHAEVREEARARIERSVPNGIRVV